ncbi:MAG: hypothetical protein II525_06475 [Bacteroidales bacterium]|nr:hypothetical protein [Bacteroidales bacterium]
MKKCYRVLQISRWRAFVACMLSIVFPLILIIPRMHACNVQWKIWVWIVTNVLIFFGLYGVILRYTATAEVEITMDETGVRFQCVKPFWLHKTGLERSFKWDEMADYTFFYKFFNSSGLYERFLLRLKNGEKFRFFHYDWIWTNDEYIQFEIDINNFFEKYHA